MKRLLIFTDDQRLAQFYYAAHLRCESVKHNYRSGQVACYSVTEAEYPHLLAIAEKLNVNSETIEPENKYRKLKRLVLHNFQPGQHFKAADVQQLTGFDRHTVYTLMKQLIVHGYAQRNGSGTKHSYSIIKTIQQSSPLQPSPKELFVA